VLACEQLFKEGLAVEGLAVEGLAVEGLAAVPLAETTVGSRKRLGGDTHASWAARSSGRTLDSLRLILEQLRTCCINLKTGPGQG